MTLVTSSSWINCSFSRPSKVRMSFCQIAAKFFFFKFKNCQTVARHKYDQSISQKNFCWLSLTNYLISKLWVPFLRVIFAIVDWQNPQKKQGNPIVGVIQEKNFSLNRAKSDNFRYWSLLKKGALMKQEIGLAVKMVTCPIKFQFKILTVA